MKLTKVCCCSIQLISLHELHKKKEKRNGQAGLVRTSLYFKKCQGHATVYDLSCSERVGEIHGVCNQVVIPTDKMNVAEFINKGKKTALLGGCVTHMHHTNIHSGKLGRGCHLLVCAGMRDVNVSAKK